MKKGFFGILVVLVIILSINLSTAQECFKGTKINTAIKASSPNLLSFHNNKLVWMGWIDDGSSLLDPYMYDFGPDGLYGTGDDSGEIRIDSAPGNQNAPDVYGNRIAWSSYEAGGGGSYDIYMYNLGPDGLYGTGDDIGKTDITPFPRGQVGAHIYGNRVIWADDRNQMNQADEIYMHDLSTGTETKIYSEGGSPNINLGTIDIYENKIVWSLWDTLTSSSNISIRDLSTGTTTTKKVTAPSQIQSISNVYGNKMVWWGYIPGSFKVIYLYDLSTYTNTQITSGTGYASSPNIYGNKIVYENWMQQGTNTSNTTYSILMYDLGADGLYGTGDDSGPTQITTKQITADDPEHLEYPLIYGNKIFWFRDNAIYMYDILNPTETCCGPIEICSDLINNNCDWQVDEAGCCTPTTEICDMADNNCDGVVDEGCGVCPDGDGDGYGVGNLSGCTDIINEDCNDTSLNINPGATEIPSDMIDNNCDGFIDLVPCENQNGVCANSQATWDSATSTWTCNYGTITNYINDETSPVNCDGLDNDCDGFVDEGCGTCELTDAYWVEKDVYEGTLVSLVVKGNNCDSKSVSFEIVEDDLMFDDDLVIDLGGINPSGASFSMGEATAQWTAEHHVDADDPPEYYFIANLLDGISAISSNVHQAAPGYPLLNVYKYCDNSVLDPGCVDPQICNPDNGTCGIPDCVTNADCNDLDNSTSDTCNIAGFCKHSLITDPIDGDGYCPDAAAYLAGDSDCSCTDANVNGSRCDLDESCYDWLLESDSCCSVECVPKECISAWDCSGTSWSDCEDGKSTRDISQCIQPPAGSPCLLYTPPSERVCIEEKFPFFNWINVMLVISMLIVFYVFRKELKI